MSEVAYTRANAWTQTYSGAQFWPLDPSPLAVRIEDIAHHLSMQCRYTGAVRRFYSVAEHSVRVSRIVPPADALWGLLHDAAEAYLVDLARPVKETPGLAAYRDAEDRLMRAICARFRLPSEMPASVKRADMELLATEKRDLMGPSPEPWLGVPEPLPFRVRPWSPAKAERMFLRRFRELTGAATIWDVIAGRIEEVLS